MYIIRTYKTYDTNKYVGGKIVDLANMKFIERSWEDIKELIRNNPGLIKNAEIDTYGRLRLKNMNPKHKIKYYNRVIKDGLAVDQYCIILGTLCNKVTFIADTSDNFIYNSDVTILDIANQLNIKNIQDLNMYNAFIDKQNNRDNAIDIYVYSGSGYRKLQSAIPDNTLLSNIKREWNIDIASITNTGISVDYIDHKKEVQKAEIPNSITHIGEFGGYVNELTLPISVKTLGIECFTHSEYLMVVNLGAGIKDIPSKCFYNSSINTIKFTGNEEIIGESAFEDSLLQGSIITGAYYIEESAFSSTNIKRVSLLRTERIGVNAFSYCSNLQKVSIRSTLKIIKHGAFKQCTKLSEINIPISTELIERNAFSGCNKLRWVKIPREVKVEDGAFPKWCRVERI